MSFTANFTFDFGDGENDDLEVTITLLADTKEDLIEEYEEAKESLLDAFECRDVFRTSNSAYQFKGYSWICVGELETATEVPLELVKE